MSVTITITGNRAFCEARNMVDESERFECDLCDGSAPDCPECKGKGYVSFPIYPYELNISNGNFCTLWNSLALSVSNDNLCGSIDPPSLTLALLSGNPELAVRQGGRSSGRGRATLIEFGISDDQAKRYHVRLAEIAAEAMKRGEFVTWG
jgi:hypothetical protein